MVYPTKGTDPEALATTINQSVSGVKATGPSAFKQEIANTTGILNAILYGVALISLIVGGLSVINTMTMSVSERTREIGVRKAIGASDGQIVRQFLAEAGGHRLHRRGLRPDPGLGGGHRRQCPWARPPISTSSSSPPDSPSEPSSLPWSWVW